MKAPVSVVINTRNAEAWLDWCLRSVRDWATDIVVVDMASTDRTVKIATAAGARLFAHEPMGYVEPARAFAVEQANQEWVLILDADELVPPALAEALAGFAASGNCDAVRLGRLNYFFGRPLVGGSWGVEQDRHVRFFRRGHIRLETHIHAQLRAAEGSRLVNLEPAPGRHLVHFNYESVSDFLQRMDRYTTVEALNRTAAGRRPSTLRAGAVEILNRYVRFGGWRDGWRGLYLALAMGLYRATTAAKMRESAELGSDTVRARHEREAARWLTPPR
jgi:glycosyltransferase involved in cell wall biosynthesis